jgi:hypothetical protein
MWMLLAALLSLSAAPPVVSAAGLWLGAFAQSEVGRKVPDEGQQHISTGTRAKYNHTPPTSGPHWPQWARWGVYEQEIPEELWVHNLEHGGIVILYRCDSPCPQLIAQLKEVYATFPKSKHGHVKLVITPYPKLKTRLAILAWTWIDELTSFDRERLLAFYRAHLDRGPEDVP